MAAETIHTARDADGLAALIARAAEEAGRRSDGSARGLPPVERWNPPFCGDIDMEIRADGRWFYMGTPIGRPALVRLFSTVLRKDEDGHTYLVTPVEKVRIKVEDAHFLGVEMTAGERDGGPVLTLRTNVGDVVEVGSEHRLRFLIEGEHRQLKPYVLVRGRLDALLSRAVMYELIERGEVIDVEGVPMFALRSGGAIFPVMPADELDQLSQ
ncbi:hypothetical protein J2858_001766 [Neorhizobium galegae]|uniref:DUF1285 domain-containing protein n=1 Tax=Neorhizobium galegae TaxID=399 RepID=UPI001AE6316A|nr:DUF1285 domain-containing protein [Neorhizobium galegae]MBP2548850.1 hypothetical protein [Neorhizobium galegae]